MNPQPSDISTCSLVAGNFSESVSEVWQLTPAQGAEVAGAILLVWAVAWVFRVLARSLNVDSSSEKETS